MCLSLWRLGNRRPVQSTLDGSSSARADCVSREKSVVQCYGHITSYRGQQGTARAFTYSAATDTSSPLSALLAAGEAASISSVRTTISATISDGESEGVGLAGAESSAFAFEAGVARLLRREGVAREVPFTAPEVTPPADQLSLRFLVLADLPIVRGRRLLQKGR